MPDILGVELGTTMKYLAALAVVLGLLGATMMVMRRFAGGQVVGGGGRGRVPRLAVLDQASIDPRRRLVLVRRDGVEHLLLIGGPTDIVVETNIVRPVAPPREVPPREAAVREPPPEPRPAPAEVASAPVDLDLGAPPPAAPPRERPPAARPELLRERPPAPARPEPPARPEIPVRPLAPVARPEPAAAAPPVTPPPLRPLKPIAGLPASEVGDLDRLIPTQRLERIDGLAPPRTTPAEEPALPRREPALKPPAAEAPPPAAATPELPAEPRATPPRLVPVAAVPPPLPVPLAPVPAAPAAPEAAKPPEPAAPAKDDKASAMFANLEDEMANLLGRGGNRP